MIRKFRIQLMLMLAALFIFTGAASAQRSTRPHRVSIATVNANYRAALEAIARRYEEMHPDTQVHVTIVGQGFETWIRTRFAAGGDLVPDLFNANYVSGYVEQGRFVFLEDYLEEISPYTGEPWRNSLDINLVERYKWVGRIYLIPLDYVEIGFFYNQDIFDEVGVDVPETWEEFLDVCAAIQEAGYIPVAMAGDYESFWAGSMGWLVRLFGDVYLRHYINVIQSRPGDWDYDPERNDGFVYDPDDPYNDLMVVMNQERVFNAILDGMLDLQSDRFRAVYKQLTTFSQYWQPGFMGSDMNSAIQLFYRQRAAMCLLTSSHVTGIIRDFKRLDPEDRFEYGVFWPPPITEDPLAIGPFRGVGGAGVMLGMTQKNDPDHEKRVVDFLMFLTSPEAGQMLVDLTLEDDQPLIGPPVIQNVELPEEIADRYEPFMNRGFEKINFRGIADEQRSVAEWTVIAQEYFAGRLSLDEFLERNYEISIDAIARLQERLGYDLDPTTEDKPPQHTAEDRRAEKLEQFWNPFLNGSLAVTLIIGAFGVFGFWHVSRARGPVRHTTITAYALLLPTFFLLGTFSYFPALSGLYYAFTNWEEGRGAAFIGLANFHRMAEDHAFWFGFRNMAFLLAAGLFKQTVVPFIAAELIIALFGNRLRYFFRTAFLVPMVVPAMVGILLWRFVYDPNVGILNQALELVGLEVLTRSWLGEPQLALPSVMFMGFPWIGALGLLIYMAGMMNVPASTYEAFRLESDNILRRIWSIDVPLVRGQTRLLVILTFIGSLQDFQAVLIMTGGGPGLSTMLPALRMYHEAFRFSNFGYGAAIGFVLFLAILLITILNLRILKPGEEL